jgi:hypothetical protein
MKPRTLLVSTAILFGLALALASAQNFPQGQSPQRTLALLNDIEGPSNKQSVGRYQGAVDQGVVYLFDTATGECWRAVADGVWKKEVGPLKARQSPRYPQQGPMFPK